MQFNVPNFAGKRHPAKLGELDTDEGKVLVKFVKSGGESKFVGLNDVRAPKGIVCLRPLRLLGDPVCDR